MRFLDLIGRTPLVELEHVGARAGVRLLAKLEGHNPGGSVKDRTAYGLMAGALERGEIRAGDRLVEATSGNTGIAMAMLAGRLGLGLTLVVPDSATAERKQAMRAYGADVVVTPPGESIEHARHVAAQLARRHGWAQLDQFGNPDNWGVHYRTTGPEIWDQTRGEVTHFVSAMGTTGTIMGVSRYLKERSSGVRIVGTQPTEGARIPGIRRWSPEMVPAIYEPRRVDRIVDVSEEDARCAARALARREGILAGMSTGGALTAALRIASEVDRGTIVFVACDRGDRYLSSELFGDPATPRTTSSSETSRRT